MAYSTVALSGSGTKTFVQDPADNTRWIYLENALTIGAIESKRGFIETTPLGSENKTFIAGDDEVQQSEISFNNILGNASNKFFHDLAVAKAAVDLRIEMKNGMRIDVNVSLAGYGMNEASRTEAYKIMYPYQRNGEPVLSEWDTATEAADLSDPSV